MRRQLKHILKTFLEHVIALPRGFAQMFIGFVFCWTPFTAPMVSGWMTRYMRHRTIRVWAGKSAPDIADTFYKDPQTAHYGYWPRWTSMREGFEPDAESVGLFRRIWRSIKGFFAALKNNYKLGLLMVFNTWILTVPFAAMWFLMWWAGWDIVFNRSYEESVFPLLSSLLSVVGFSIVMLYLPIAQARMAVHGNWSSFFDLRTIMIIARHVRFRLLLLSLLFALGSLGVVGGTKVLIVFFENLYGVDTRDIEALREPLFLHYCFVIWCFYIGLFVLKRMNAKIYAIGLIKALSSGAMKTEDLSGFERDILIDKLHFQVSGDTGHTQGVARLVLPVLSGLRNLTLALLTFALWGIFVFTIYAGQFATLNNADWLNHPLIQMPYIRYPTLAE